MFLQKSGCAELMAIDEELSIWYLKDFDPEESILLIEKGNSMEDDEYELMVNQPEYVEEDDEEEDIYGEVRNYHDNIGREEILSEDEHAAGYDEIFSSEGDEDTEVHVLEKCHGKSSDSFSITE